MRIFKASAAALLLLAVLFQCGCAVGRKETPKEKLEKLLGFGDKDITFETDIIDGLKEKNLNGIYDTVAAFLGGDTGSMPTHMTSVGDVNMYEECGYSDVKIGEFRFIVYSDAGPADKAALYFEVESSGCEYMPKGEYYYSVDPISWSRLDVSITDEKYSDAAEIIKLMADNDAVSWENGVGTYTPDYFKFAVFRTASVYLKRQGLSMTDDNLKSFASSVFGIEDFAPELYIDSEKVDFYEKVDGVWQEKHDSVYIGALTASASVCGVRENDGAAEIDLQYYADAFCLVPSHKVPAYMTKTDGGIGWLRSKSVITENGKYAPYVRGF